MTNKNESKIKYSEEYGGHIINYPLYSAKYGNRWQDTYR